jgi:TetR/AcrR family transcriptional repressor of nem operon
VVAAAIRLFRERGVQAVSVADVMAAAGLTHGGFYRHFASKEALLAEAIAQAFAERDTMLGELDERGHDQARRDFLDGYLSAAHRDDPGGGCPTAGFGADVARDGDDGVARAAYAKGVESYGRWWDGAGGEDLAAVSTLVGALFLARATAGTPVSDRILEAARAALTA